VAAGVEVAEAATDVAPRTEEGTTVGGMAGTGVAAADELAADVANISPDLRIFPFQMRRTLSPPQLTIKTHGTYTNTIIPIS
jgi:hypothetical protein